VVLSGAVRTLRAGGPLGMAVGFLQIVVAGALLVRAREARAASTPELLGAVPSLVLAGGVMAAAGERAWGTAALCLAAAGVALAAAGILSLGASFGILPGVRALRTRGLYRCVRHPIYLGEALLFLAAAGQIGWLGAVATLGMVPLLAWRITVEERLLAAEPGWREWAAQVRWRLVPGVW
jgi:protein-S-isoprenylcysteine O-methyltransferase Ste14